MAPTSRIVGVDVARFVALAGMMAVHILPGLDGSGDVTLSQELAGGRASALFAVLAGVSLTLAAGRRPLPGDRWARVAGGIAVRSLLVGALGLWLGGLDSGIAVILTYYAVLFLLGAPFLVATTRSLFVLAAVWVVAAPVLSQIFRGTLEPRRGPSPAFAQLSEPLTLLQELLLTGYYPAFVWLAYLLFGMGLGRLDLRSPRVITVIGLAGAAMVAAAYVVSDALLSLRVVRDELVALSGGSEDLLEADLVQSFAGTTPTESAFWLLVRAPHSGAPLDLVQTIGSAAIVLAAALAVARAAPRAAAVVFGAGAMTLTLYTLHVWLRVPGRWDADTVDVYVGQLALVALIGTVFAALRWRGPLEWVVGAASGLVNGRRVGFRTGR